MLNRAGSHCFGDAEKDTEQRPVIRQQGRRHRFRAFAVRYNIKHYLWHMGFLRFPRERN